MIDETTHMGHLKGCLIDFCRAFFGIDDLPVRFRPSYFPFTEPSAEVDIGCSRAGGELTIGAGDDWLEILGCGMVHPKVLRQRRPRPGEYQGFAFGMGIERIAMLKYGIPDLRTFFDADIRWLRHYGFAAAGRALAGRGARADEVHAGLAEGASRDRRLARRDRDKLTAARPRGRGRRRPGRGAGALHRRPCGLGRAAPQCRQAQGVHGRHRQAKTVQVVCGAPNARTGMLGVFAPAGSYIPGTGITLTPGVIRGVESNGMLVSEREMGLSRRPRRHHRPARRARRSARRLRRRCWASTIR